MSSIKPDGLYCAYLRKSRRDEEMEALGQGETLARHEKQLAGLAARLGIAIGHTYREIVSGDTIAERPQVRQLLSDVGAGLWDGVLVMDVDRLGRGDSIDQGIIMQTFMYAGVLLITPDKIYDPANDSDGEFFEMKLFFARREYKAITKRMQRGRLASAMDGCYMGSRPVYGYERVKLAGRKGWSLKVVPEKAEIVRSVFAWYADGIDGQEVGAAVIADRLNQMGLRTDLGHRFEPSYIRNMLQNPVYIGKVQWNQRVTKYRIQDGQRVKSRPKYENPVLADGFHEGIVDPALFARVQSMFAGHAKRPKNLMLQQVNPFAGLMVCSCCGKHMQRKPDPLRGGDFLYCPTQHCPTCSTYISVVEDAVLSVLARWAVEFDGAQAPADLPSAPEIAAARAAAAQLSEQRATLDGQMRRLYDLLEQGIYSADLYRERRDELTARIGAIDENLAALSRAPRPDARVALVPQIRTVLAAYAGAADAAEKNRLLRSVIDHIVYTKTQRCYRNSAPADHLSLQIFPRLPDDHDHFCTD